MKLFSGDRDYFACWQSGQSVQLTFHVNLVPRLRMPGAKSPFSHACSCGDACHRQVQYNKTRAMWRTVVGFVRSWLYVQIYKVEQKTTDFIVSPCILIHTFNDFLKIQ